MSIGRESRPEAPDWRPAVPLAALVVGLGRAGSGYDEVEHPGGPLSHAGAYVACSTTVLVAGVDPDPGARARFERRWSTPAYASAAEALRCHQPLLVSVATPPEGRLEMLRPLLDAPVLALWMEKPLAASVSAAKQIARLCAERDVALQVNYQRRFDPLHRHAIDLVRAAGGAVHIDIRYSGPVATFAHHAFDLYRWLLGDPEAVAAVPVGPEPVGVVTRGGTVGTFCRVPTSPTIVFDVDVWAPRVRIALGGLGEELHVATAERSPRLPGTVRHGAGSSQSGGLSEAMAGGVQSLVDHVTSGAELLCSAADGIGALRLEAALAQAATSGRTIRMDA